MWFYRAYGLNLASTGPIPGLWPADSGTTPDLAVWFGPESGGNIDLSQLPQECVYVSPDQDDTGSPILEIWEKAGSAYTVLAYRYGIRFVLDRSTSRLWVAWPVGQPRVDEAALLLQGLVMSLVLRRRGTVTVHGVALAAQGRAIVLFGPGGIGKSTLGAALITRGFALLADDLVALVETENGFSVQPGCPRLHLWPDAIRLVDGLLPLSPLMPGWDKGYLDLSVNAGHFHPHPLPLGAIYLVESPGSADQTAKITPVSVGTALTMLLSDRYVPYLMPESMRLTEFSVLNRLVERVPVKRMVWGRGTASMTATCQAILRDAEEAAKEKSTLKQPAAMPSAPTANSHDTI